MVMQGGRCQGSRVWPLPHFMSFMSACTINYVCMLFTRIHYAAAAVTCMIPIIISGIAIARYTHNLL